MTRLTAFLGAATLALAAGTASAQDASTVVVTVGDTDITLGELIIARAQLPQQYAQLPDDVLLQGLIDQLVQQQLLADTLEDVPARVELALTNEERSLRAGEVVTALSESAVTEDAIQTRFDEMTAGGEAEPATEYNASHLLVETEEEAVAAAERIEGGEDFATVATEVSTGPSAPNGGELGWFGAGMMVPEFETAVAEMEVGAISEPVQTQFGWHIIKLNETRPVAPPELADVSDEIAASLQEEAITARIEELRAGTEVTMGEEIDPALVNDLSLLED